MGKSRLGCMTIWAPGLTMMLPGRDAPLCSTVRMEAGKIVAHTANNLSLHFIYLVV